MRDNAIVLGAVATSVGADDDEAALVRAAREDAVAFAPLYDRYQPRIYAYLRVRLDSEEDAADATQRVFMRALEALPRYRLGRAPFGAWLFRIARNVAADVHRRRRHMVAWENVPMRLEPPDDVDVEAAVLQREALARLRTLVEALDPDTRDLLALRFVGRLTAADIGAVMGINGATARKRLARALQRLKEQYYEPPTGAIS